ncbi:hypothetical protein FIV42_12070 [Persicimonas caeni]|uniref:Alginate export domain-containing protein n=1 Tax=Persicimonas caeni TaxID=2292766 RepID=A0A4Y6PT97_PERCE|nr:hypothetical protein [Persicimonas caeni]QDG51453.1 hypothetical protein FIV42_12070 [Persicimonas caeni]QED32674.1 hypothetical protein FRD00_12065 [Persicimonas caeni]
MKFKLFLLAAITGAAVAPNAALAQEYGPDDASSINVTRELDEEVDEELEDEKLSWDFRLTNEFHSFDNLDLRPFDPDEISPQEIEQFDDRQMFGYTSVSAGVAYDVLDDTTFNFGGVLSGMWGNDQVGSATDFQTPIYVYDLSVDWTAVDTGTFQLSTTLGRQGYAIGGVSDDYFFKDIVDGVSLNVDMGMAGRLRLMFDVFGEAGRPENVDFADFIGANAQTTNNFDGDTDVYRYGGVYEMLDIVDGFDLRAFGYGSYIGAARAGQLDDTTSTGTDISAQGQLANFADEDYTFMFGARANYTLVADAFELGLMAEFARSQGIDRKNTNLGLYDVNTNGNAYGAAANLFTDLGAVDVEGRLRFFRADGNNYTEQDGLLFNHGFVSMKGSEIGGINMERYAGWHPTSYVSGFKGIFDNPQDIDRKAGTMLVRAGAGFTFVDKIRLDLDGWFYQDTSETNFDVARAPEIDTPFGIGQPDLEAQERLGKTLGYELNAALTYIANDALSLYGIGGIFLPGEFYEIEIERAAGTALGAPNGDADELADFWVVSGGATLAF